MKVMFKVDLQVTVTTFPFLILAGAPFGFFFLAHFQLTYIISTIPDLQLLEVEARSFFWTYLAGSMPGT